jgi:hypothetical protein
MFSSGLFTGICSLSANVLEHTVGMQYTSYLLTYDDVIDRVLQNIDT